MAAIYVRHIFEFQNTKIRYSLLAKGEEIPV